MPQSFLLANDVMTITSSTLHMLNGGIVGYFVMKFYLLKQNTKSWFKNNVSAA